MKRESPEASIKQLLELGLLKLNAERRQDLRAHDEAAAAVMTAPAIKAQIDSLKAQLVAERNALAMAEGGGTWQGLRARLNDGMSRAEMIAKHKSKIAMLEDSLAAGEAALKLTLEADAEHAGEACRALKEQATRAMQARLRQLQAFLEAAAAANELVRAEWAAWRQRGAGFGTAFGDPAYLLLSDDGIALWRRNNPFKF